MSKVISGDVWFNSDVVLSALRAKRRIYCVAYVTRHLPPMFRDGDVLICDASEKAVASGETDPSVLLKLLQMGVLLYSVSGLHVKCAVFDDVVLVGSANMSMSSAEVLTEAAVLCDDAELASSLCTFMRGIVKDHKPLDKAGLESLLPRYRQDQKPWQESAVEECCVRPRCQVPMSLEEPGIWGGSLVITTWPEGGESADALFYESGDRGQKKVYKKLSKDSILAIRRAIEGKKGVEVSQKTIRRAGVPVPVTETHVHGYVHGMFDRARYEEDYLELFAVDYDPPYYLDEHPMAMKAFAGVTIGPKPSRHGTVAMMNS